MSAVPTPVTPDDWNWRAPNNPLIWDRRLKILAKLRQDPALLAACIEHYRSYPTDFVRDWACCFDPRQNPARTPMVLFKRQIELLEAMLAAIDRGTPLLVVKSRDAGATTLFMMLIVTLCLFRRDIACGVGSATESKIDKHGDSTTAMAKAQQFLENLPHEFLFGWDPQRDRAHLRIGFRHTGSQILGEAGSNIARGRRFLVFGVDESAHLQWPDEVDSALATATKCRIDVSSANGLNNSFGRKVHEGNIEVFRFHWTDDPRKSQEWYEEMLRTLPPVVVAQEIDMNFMAGTVGQLIPAADLALCVDAHIKLGLRATGTPVAALDVADEGHDKNALAIFRGPVLVHLEQWSGRGSDVHETALRAAGRVDHFGGSVLRSDQDGIGSGIRASMNLISKARREAGKPVILDEPHRGSARPPEGELVPGRDNVEFFANNKAYTWWYLRLCVQHTALAVRGEIAPDPRFVLSITSDLPERDRLMQQLVTPTYTLNSAGKVVVDKQGGGTTSPDMGDSVAMARLPAPGDAAGYFSAPATTGDNLLMLAPAPQVPTCPMPRWPDILVASVCTGTNPNRDTIAVVYFAISDVEGVVPARCIVLDYDLVELGAATIDQFVPRMLGRLADLTHGVRPRLSAMTGPMISVCPTALGGYIFKVAEEHHATADWSPVSIRELDPGDRVLMASNFVRTGEVRFATQAVDRIVSYRSMERNFLLDAVSKFTSISTIQPEHHDLLVALADGILLGIHDRIQRVPTSKGKKQ